MTWLNELLDGTRTFVDTDIECCLCKSEIRISAYERRGTHYMSHDCDYACPAARGPIVILNCGTPSRADIARLLAARASTARELSKLLADHATKLAESSCKTGGQP